ncbi:MAG: hypothetical protein ACRD1V_04270, partial [Vicinamibacterales bacterium]
VHQFTNSIRKGTVHHGALSGFAGDPAPQQLTAPCRKYYRPPASTISARHVPFNFQRFCRMNADGSDGTVIAITILIDPILI